jgi:hypothetical protein
MLLLVSFSLVGLFQIFFPFYPFGFGGFAFLPMDPVYFLMILKIVRYAAKHPKSMGKLIRRHFFLMAFLGMLAVYVVLYTPTYGQSAIGEARKYYFPFLIPLVALISVKSLEDLRRLFLVLVVVAFCIALVGLTQLGMQGSILRVLNAEATLTIELVVFAMLVHRIHKMVIVGPRLDTVLLLLFSTFVLGSGQRSCWLAVGLGLMLLLWLYRYRPILLSKTVMLGLVGLTVLTAAMIMFPAARSRLAEKFGGISDPYDDKNASWRIEGWKAQWGIIKQNVFFGEGIGNYYSWKFRQTQETESPHNAYFQTLMKFGSFGLILYGLLVVQFFRKTLRVRRKLRPGPTKAYIEMAILSFGATHAYMIGYGFHPFALVFFGVGISAVKLAQESTRQPQAVQLPAGADRSDQSAWSVCTERAPKEQPFLSVESYRRQRPVSS